MRSKQNSHTLLLEYKIVQLLWKKFWQFYVKLNIYLSFDSAIPSSVFYLREMKTNPQKDLYKNVYNIFIYKT